jgi:hypothetical protein
LPAEAASLSASAFLCLTCALTCALALASCGAGDPPPGALRIPPNAAQVRCVNTTSGATWTIPLDAAQSLANHRPARFGQARVDWGGGADGSVFDLDLAHGLLTVTRGSSTGGWVAKFACKA